MWEIGYFIPLLKGVNFPFRGISEAITILHDFTSSISDLAAYYYIGSNYYKEIENTIKNIGKKNSNANSLLQGIIQIIMQIII